MNKNKKRKKQKRKRPKVNKKSPNRARVNQDHPKGAPIGQIKQQNNAQNNERGLREARKENHSSQPNAPTQLKHHPNSTQSRNK